MLVWRDIADSCKNTSRISHTVQQIRSLSLYSLNPVPYKSDLRGHFDSSTKYILRRVVDQFHGKHEFSLQGAKMQNSSICAHHCDGDQSVNFVVQDSFLVDNVLVEDQTLRIRHFSFKFRRDLDMANLAMYSGVFLEEEKSRHRKEEKNDLALSLCISLWLYFIAYTRYIQSLAIVIILCYINRAPGLQQH